MAACGSRSSRSGLARSSAAGVVGVDHPAVGPGQGAVHPQGLGHAGAARRARAARDLLGRTGSASPEVADRIQLRPHAGAGLFRHHHVAARVCQRKLPCGGDPDRRGPVRCGQVDLSGQVRRARRRAGRRSWPRGVECDARRDPQLFWRSRHNNQVNIFYYAESDGCIKQEKWKVFWYGLENFEQIQHCVAHCATRQPTLLG